MTRRCSRPAALPMPGVRRFGRIRAPCRDKTGPVPSQHGNNCTDPATIVSAQHASQRDGTPDQPQNTAAHARPGTSDQPQQTQSP
jgi:hypothetical protein